MRRIGVHERRARLAARQHLGIKAAGIAEATGGLIALHATDPASVYLSAWARVDGLGTEHVDKALYGDRTLVRMLGMRRTMFVVPAELAPVIQAACTDQVAARLRRALIQAIEGAGIAQDAEGWLRDVTASVRAALAQSGSAIAAELVAGEPRLRTRIVVAEGKSYGGEVTLTSRILNLISAEGLIQRGRPRGGWTSTQYEWVPTEPGGKPADEARAELARRWLCTFGPAPVKDLQWWTGWTGAQVKAALRDIDTEEVDLDGQPGIRLSTDDPAEEPGPWVALLPALDPTAMGWQDRDWFLGPHRELLFDRSGNIGPTIWWDGRIVGGWAQRSDGEIVTRLLGDADAEAVETEAGKLQEWLGPRRFVPKFRTPLERELSA